MTFALGATYMLGMPLGSQLDPRKTHHGLLLSMSAGTYHPDPKLFATEGGGSGFTDRLGSTIFQAGEGALIWSVAAPPDTGLTNPIIEIQDLSGNTVARINAQSDIVPASIPFPFYVDGGFQVEVIQGTASMMVSWSRVTGRE